MLQAPAKVSGNRGEPLQVPIPGVSDVFGKGEPKAAVRGLNPQARLTGPGARHWHCYGTGESAVSDRGLAQGGLGSAAHNSQSATSTKITHGNQAALGPQAGTRSRCWVGNVLIHQLLSCIPHLLGPNVVSKLPLYGSLFEGCRGANSKVGKPS